MNSTGLYIIAFPPQWGGGRSKGLEMGKGKEEGKKRKKENLGKIKLLAAPNHNKAGYTATPVAYGWAGPIFEVSGAFGQGRRIYIAKNPINAEKVKCDGRTDKAGCSRVARD